MRGCCFISQKSSHGRILLIALALFLNGCLVIPEKVSYSGPPARPDWLRQYYAITDSYLSVHEHLVEKKDDFSTKLIEMETSHLGPITIDYYQQETPSDTLILVFPILGGKNYRFEKYFAEYFALHGFDAAIIHRSDAFKDPNQSAHLEKVLRENVIRDRIALNFFEGAYRKKHFGTFGLSRGGINVAITAGVDDRLKYNVIIMGGSDLVGIFRHSEQKGIKKYRDRVLSTRNISKEELYTFFRTTLKTDPKYIAPYIDARNTLMILSVLDRTVPFKYGMELRKLIGKPKTIFLLSNHYTSLLYTQFFPILLPSHELCIFPIDYVENEALSFYQESFGTNGKNLQSVIFSLLRFPIEIARDVQCASNKTCRKHFPIRPNRIRLKGLTFS